MKIKTLALSVAVAAAQVATAHTVLLSEDFNGDYTANFPTMIDGDGLPLASGISSMFLDKNGVAQPWWPLKDSSADTDRFMTSHSIYMYDGASKDYLVSKPITIPTTGFTLSFGAQSIKYSGGDRLLSDLHLFILEQAPTKADLPGAEKATKVYTQVPAGDDPDMAAGEFTRYELNLDPWVGKTVYIVFANLNYKKDFLAIDDVLVMRPDVAALTGTAPEYVKAGEFPLDITLSATADQSLGPWTLSLKAGEFTATETGTQLIPGQDFKKTFSIPVAGDQKVEWEARLQCEGINDLVTSGSTTGLMFVPERKVLFEESTGTWCGNCPMGIYTLECMAEDPQLAGKVIPIAVHIHDQAKSEPMVCDEYNTGMGITVAPWIVIDRVKGTGLVPAYDCNYDSSNPKGVAGITLLEQQRLTLAEVSISNVERVENAGTPGAVKVTAVMTPAVTLDGKLYKLGFALTEDNVGIEFGDIPTTHMSLITHWMQHNYMKGHDEYTDHLNGWCDLPSAVMSVRYQHVARAVKGFWGIDGSLPDTPLKGGEQYTFTTTIDIPDTYMERKSNADGNTYMVAPAVDFDNLNVIAYIVNTETGEIINAAEVTANGRPHEHFDTKWLVDHLAGVEAVETAGPDATAEYFTIDGLRVSEPVKGQIYIVRRGAQVSKVVF